MRALAMLLALRAGTALATPLIVEEATEGAGRLHVACRLDAVKGTCFVDTGAMRSAVDCSGAFWRYRVERTQLRAGVAAVPERVDEVILDGLEVDGRTFAKVPIHCRRGPGFRDVLLGIDVLARQTLLLDFAAGELRLGAPNPRPAAPRLPLELRRGTPLVPVAVGGMPLKAIFDTGAMVTVIDRRRVAALGPALEHAFDAGITDITGEQLPARYYRARELRVGDEVFEDVLVAAIDLRAVGWMLGADVPLILGHNVIGQLSWFLDFRRKAFTAWR